MRCTSAEIGRAGGGARERGRASCGSRGADLCRLVGLGALALVLLAGCSAGSQNGQGAAAADAPGATLESPLGSYLAGRFAHAERDTPAAAEFFSQALADDPENSALAHRTLLLLIGDGRMAEARQLAVRFLKSDPHDGVASVLLAADAMRGNDPAAAERLLTNLPQTGFNTLLVPMVGGWARFGEGKIDEALQALLPLKDNAAFAPFLNYHSALMNDTAGRVAAADAAYRDTIAGAAAGSLRIVEAYGNFLERQGRRADAEKLYKNFLVDSPDSPAIASLLAGLGQGAKPAPLVGSANDGAAEAFFGAASVLSRQDGGEAAEIYLQLAIYLRRDFVVARILLADILQSTQRIDEALTLYESVDPKSLFGWSAQLRAASALEELNRPDDAIALLRKMSAAEPARLEPQTTIGDILRSQQKFAEAADAYGVVIARIGKPTEQQWALYYARGITYERSKQWPKAEADFKMALQLKPDEPLVLNYLGYSWVERGEHLDEALDMLKRAVQLKPNDGFVVDSLGWAQFRLGHFADAVGNLERAVELKADDPTINDHLGDAYWRVGRHAEARFQWQRALGLKPEPGLVPAIRAKLDAGLGASAGGDKSAQAVKGG